MCIRKLFIKNMIAVIVTLLCLQPVIAANNNGAEEAKKCLSLVRIDNIDVIDNQNIVFHTTGEQDYLNTLPYACSGLYQDKAIMYKTSLSELCDLDVITVLDSIGMGYQSGATCGLGKFKPVSKNEIKMLKEKHKQG